jgi:hypothetical protein
MAQRLDHRAPAEQREKRLRSIGDTSQSPRSDTSLPADGGNS